MPAARAAGGEPRVGRRAAHLRQDAEFADPQRHLVMLSFEAERAKEWFDSGLRLVEQLDARSAACVLAMTGIYRSILDRIKRDPAQVLRQRVSLGPFEKTWVAARSLVGARAGAAA